MSIQIRTHVNPVAHGGNVVAVVEVVDSAGGAGSTGMSAGTVLAVGRSLRPTPMYESSNSPRTSLEHTRAAARQALQQLEHQLEHARRAMTDLGLLE